MADQFDRRTTILRSAARLFAEKGIAATTVREIADSVGVLSGSLYHHFPSKDAIVDEVVASYLRDLLTGYRSVLARDLNPRDTVRALVEASMDAIDHHPYATDIYRREMRRLQLTARSSVLSEAAAEVQHTWLTTLEAGRARGVFRRDVPAWVMYRLIRDALFQSSPLGAAHRSRTLAATFSSLILDGAAERPAASRRRVLANTSA